MPTSPKPLLLALLAQRTDVPAAVREALATEIIEATWRYPWERAAWTQSRWDDRRDARHAKDGVRLIEPVLQWLAAPMAERTFEEEELADMTGRLRRNWPTPARRSSA